MGSPCSTEIFATDNGSRFVRYEYNDRNGNELIDPNELICKGVSSGAQKCNSYNPPHCWQDFDEESAKWSRQGTAISFYKRLIAGYSHTSEVKPHEADELFRIFSGRISITLFEQFKKQLESAEASHRKNAARDLDLFVRRDLLDFINHSGDEVEKEIERVLKIAEASGVDTEKYYQPIADSLRKAIKRMELQSNIDNQDRSQYIGVLKKLIGVYAPPSPPAHSPEKKKN